MNEVLNNPVRSQTEGADAICQSIGSVGLMDCRSRPVSAFSRKNEIDTDFAANDGLACCGEELKPFWADDGRFMSVCSRCGQKYTDKTQARYGGSPWIGVDLDGTLAHDLGNKGRNHGSGLDEIGSPIKPMLNRVQKWIAEGKTVKIFTARASSPRQIVAVKKWLIQHGLPDLEVTNTKDLRMIELWDDRCVQVSTNLGEPINKTSEYKNKPRPTRADAGRQGSFSGLVYRLKILLAF
jgi:hypothetical protein